MTQRPPVMPTDTQPNPYNLCDEAIKRRAFLRISLSGFAGLALPGLSQLSARAAPEKPKSGAIAQALTKTESTHFDRTDRFEEKMMLLEAAWRRKDFRLARALAHSLRSTAIQAQAEEENPGTPLVTAGRFETVESLPSPWRNWAQGWRFCKALTLDESTGQERSSEPVEVLLSFPAEQVISLTREVRVARMADGALKEVPCQVFGEVRRGKERLCKLLFMADSPARQKQTFLVFYGNPDAELPQYT